MGIWPAQRQPFISPVSVTLADNTVDAWERRVCHFLTAMRIGSELFVPSDTDLVIPTGLSLVLRRLLARAIHTNNVNSVGVPYMFFRRLRKRYKPEDLMNCFQDRMSGLTRFLSLRLQIGRQQLSIPNQIQEVVLQNASLVLSRALHL